MALRRRGGAGEGKRAPRAVRGLGRGRKTRRVIAAGGAGPARRINETLADWPEVRISPMFGRWGYFVGPRLFGCLPLREQDHDLWLRLPLDEQRRALARGGVRPHRRFARRGWVEIDVESPQDVSQALGWLRRAYVAARAAGGDDTEDG
jgi:hypothetical protein